MRSETVLVVDDDQTTLTFCRNALTLAGYDVFSAQAAPLRWKSASVNGTGSRWLSRRGDAGNDWHRPGQTSRSCIPQVQNCLMSGYSPRRDRLIGHEGSSYRIFWKPFDVRLFLQMIRNVLDAPMREQVNVAHS